MLTPNPFAAYSFFKGDITKIDFLHLVQESDGSIPGWIDEAGIGRGTLASGGGGGSTVFVEGSPITNPNFLPGAGVSFLVSGSNVTISASVTAGVSSLNAETGALTLTSSDGSLSVASVGNNINLEVVNPGGATGASFTTTAATSDTVSVTGVTSSSFVALFPTNAIAAAMVAAGGTYVSSVSTGTVVVTHPNTSGATFDIVASAVGGGGVGGGVTSISV